MAELCFILISRLALTDKMPKEATSSSTATQGSGQKSSAEPKDKNNNESTGNKGTDAIAKRKLNKHNGKESKLEQFAKECVNPSCPRKSNVYQEASRFVLAFFYVTPKNEIQLACADCLEQAVATFEKMGEALLNNLLIADIKIPQKQEIIEITDSDDEEPQAARVPVEQKISFNKALEDEIESILNDFSQKIDLRRQHQSIRDDFEKRISHLEKENLQVSLALSARTVISLKQMNNLQVQEKLLQLERSSTRMYNELYAVNKPKIERRPSIDADADRPRTETQTMNTEPIPAASNFVDIPFDQLPVQNEPLKDEEKFFYAIRVRGDGRKYWDACRLLSTRAGDDGKKIYKVEFVTNDGDLETQVEVSGKELALNTTNVNLRAGARVISRHFDFARNGLPRGRFLPGVVGEKLCKYNQKRYLIFCDYGYVQYVRATNVREIAETSENVWEDCHPNLQRFIENYLKQSASSQLRVLNLRAHQRMPTERKGKWHDDALVREVDASLARIYFPELNVEEWMFRGSKR